VTAFLDRLLNLPAGVVYLLVGALVFAEDALFVGFVLPGETAAILGGVAASLSHVSLTLISLTVVAAAIAGDSVGYQVGARYGTRVVSVRALQRRRDQLDAARATLARRGGLAVFFGRFVAFLRAVMPFLAGTSHMPYRRFLVYNAAGGVVWGVGSVLLGYLAAHSYAAIEKTVGRAAAAVFAGLVIVGLLAWRIQAWRRDHGARSS
jgi:membrane protein DedA with SNARE-associated domain